MPGSAWVDATPYPDPFGSGGVVNPPLTDPIPGLSAAEVAVGAETAVDAVVDLRDASVTGLHLVEAPALPFAPDRPHRGLRGAAPWQLRLKRQIDVWGALTLLVLLLPVLLVTVAMVRLSSRGPALYVQQRVGRNGRPFRMLKLRSMHANAHQERPAIVHLNEVTGPVFKVRDDPRVTRVGRLLRRFSLDELPQLFNVLRGDMSLVGPRPPLPEEYAEYGPRERQRLRVVPGITCIWQVKGRSDLDFDTWVDMDLEYIEGWSIREDLKLLLLTIPAVVSGRGAY